MRHTVIPLPGGSRFVPLRPEFVAVCDGNACAALVLAVFDWRAAQVLNSSDLKEEMSPWVRASVAWLRRWLGDGFGDTAVRSALQLLVDLKLIERRESEGTSDRSKEYRLVLQAVVEALGEIEQWPDSISGNRQVHLPESPNLARASDSAFEEVEEEQQRAQARAGADDASVDEPLDVWLHYVQTMKPRMKSLGDQERRLIRDALKVATGDECKRAITGCAASPWHMGENPHRKRYCNLSQIIRGKRGGKTTREQIDMFIEIADRVGVSRSGVQSADPVKVKDNKRRVTAGWEFPNDTIVVRQAQDAETWLAAHGVVVERDEQTGRPTFRWR